MVEICKKCNNLIAASGHKCPPEWQAIDGDDGELGPEDEPEYTAYGNTAEDAALWLAEQEFSNWDYPRVMSIWVRRDDTDTWKKFNITVEAVPSFSATEVKE